jgi:hypothetical protein
MCLYAVLFLFLVTWPLTQPFKKEEFSWICIIIIIIIIIITIVIIFIVLRSAYHLRADYFFDYIKFFGWKLTVSKFRFCLCVTDDI